MRNDQSYSRVFSGSIPLETYARCLEFVKMVAHEMRVREYGCAWKREVQAQGELLFALFMACSRLGWSSYGVADLARLSVEPLTEAEWQEAVTWFDAQVNEYRSLPIWKSPEGLSLGGLLRSKKFPNACIRAIKERLAQSSEARASEPELTRARG